MNDFGLCNKHFDEQNEEEDCIVCEKDKAIRCVKARNKNLQQQIEELEKWLRMTMNCKNNSKGRNEPALCPMCREIIQKALKDKK